MKKTITLLFKTQLLVGLLLLAGFTNNIQASPPPSSGLIGQWTFESGVELKDLTGNFADLVLTGATVANGQLNVDNSSTYAIAQGYSGATIGEKTLVSWLYLENLNVQTGSALTIDRISSDIFDAIVYGEQQYHRWMAGSSYFSRTQPPIPGYEETTTGQLIKMAISYENNGGNAHIKIYHNDSLIGDYTKGAMASWPANDAEILFGIRHTPPNGGSLGALDAKIEEARIYNRVLSAQEIESLQLYNTAPAQIPLSDWALYFGIFLILVFTVMRFRRMI